MKSDLTQLGKHPTLVYNLGKHATLVYNSIEISTFSTIHSIVHKNVH